MAGRKRKPCEFCENDNWYIKDGGHGHKIAVAICTRENIIEIASFANRESGEEETLEANIKMNFCPMCGRKMGC